MSELNLQTPVYSIGVVQEKTGLTGRQIRYYEQSDLIKPSRTKGNQRIYSEQDIDRLKKIKGLLEKGLNIAGIKEKLGTACVQKNKKKLENPYYNSSSLKNKFSRGKAELTSLYPVSNRAKLLEILDKKDSK